MPVESQALTLLRDERTLRVRQVKEWGEILTGFEGRNRYEVVGDDGGPLFFAGEVGSGLGLFLLRGFLKAKRPFTMELKSASGETLLRLRRPWRFWLSRLEVEDGEGRHLGAIQQRFRFFTRAYEVLGPGGEELARLNGPFFRPWTFNVEQQGREVGTIAKKWSGFGKELFTDADNFGVRFDGLRDPLVRTLVVAATFLIDFVHFEDRRGGND
ncbi:scramblase [Corallococcus sp. AB049A]|uniref:Scramblase n=1 Tax=Corallococcus interemptor TaxID=2316720 RepID=A0A3A8PYZ1_9BACT|nr:MULTISPECIES: phospholipid scramblase-related protein [Corallococcus]RKH42508.1 scramblase [Corallococcus sp. AB050B]RKH60281.1 scramblase [Corallococcus interemptor]RKI52435.1 scramblase [Corallococcus sp. AB049A]